jgi:hypothetical protein
MKRPESPAAGTDAERGENMTREQAETLWEKFYCDALGAGHSDPDAYARERLARLRQELRR